MIKDNAFEYVKDNLRIKYAEAFISDTQLSDTVPSFPAIAIVRSNNAVNRAFSTLSSIEQGVKVEYTVDVYTNDIEKKEEQSIEIMEYICDLFTNLGYYRDFEGAINNLLDNSIARRNARFTNKSITKK